MDKQPIRAMRQEAGLTIKEAAALFDVNRVTIIRWEKGEPCIPLKRLDEASRIFGATKRDLRPDIFAGAE